MPRYEIGDKVEFTRTETGTVCQGVVSYIRPEFGCLWYYDSGGNTLGATEHSAYTHRLLHRPMPEPKVGKSWPNERLHELPPGTIIERNAECHGSYLVVVLDFNDGPTGRHRRSYRRVDSMFQWSTFRDGTNTIRFLPTN